MTVPHLCFFLQRLVASANFGFPLSNIPLNINVNNTTNGGVLKGETFGTGNGSDLWNHDQRIHKQSEATTNGADAVVIAADKDALFYDTNGDRRWLELRLGVQRRYRR